MAQISKQRKRALDRIEIVTGYLSTDMAVTTFAELFNSGGIYRALFEETGPVDAEALDRWTDICMKVIEEEGQQHDETVFPAV